MKIKKSETIDYVIYCCFVVFVICDFCKCIFNVDSLLVAFSFLPCVIISIVGFIKAKGFLSIDQLLYVFVFMFCYYTPLHQYVKGTNIHHFNVYTDRDYLVANVLIVIFLAVYMIVRKKEPKLVSSNFIIRFRVNTLALIALLGVSTLCLLWLQMNHALFSFSDVSGYVTDESSKVIFLKIMRFIPMAALLIAIYAYRDKTMVGKIRFNRLVFGIIALYCLIIYFPLNGTLSRYLLFGAYIMVIRALYEKHKHKSYIILIVFLGFYFVFPAFNFFKYHTLTNISKFQLGGFDASYIDYDAYQMFMQSIKYVSSHGMLFGKNIITAALCIVPRSIWNSKLDHSGALVADAYNASFANLSCPLFAEFYLAFGVIGIIVFTYLFACMINSFEARNATNNALYRAMYSIAAGMIISFLRGAILPMTSFWVCLSIALFICIGICAICTK